MRKVDLASVLAILFVGVLAIGFLFGPTLSASETEPEKPKVLAVTEDIPPKVEPPPPPPPVVEEPPAPAKKITAAKPRRTTARNEDISGYEGDVWWALAQCESPTGRDSDSGRYHGYFQFTLSTWASVGGTGDPHEYSYEEQRAMAQKLQARSGWGQWPACARKLGLR